MLEKEEKRLIKISLLHKAVARKDITSIRELLRNKHNVNEKNEATGSTPLHIAVKKPSEDSINIIQSLLNYGAEQLPDNKEKIPLDYVINNLLNLKKDYNAFNSENKDQDDQLIQIEKHIKYNFDLFNQIVTNGNISSEIIESVWARYILEENFIEEKALLSKAINEKQRAEKLSGVLINLEQDKDILVINDPITEEIFKNRLITIAKNHCSKIQIREELEQYRKWIKTADLSDLIIEELENLISHCKIIPEKEEVLEVKEEVREKKEKILAKKEEVKKGFSASIIADYLECDKEEENQGDILVDFKIVEDPDDWYDVVMGGGGIETE